MQGLSSFHDQGLNLHFLHWKGGVLTTRPPGKSQNSFDTSQKTEQQPYFQDWGQRLQTKIYIN